MFVCMDKESGRKATIPESSRFNQFLVVGPSGTGKTSLVFEPMVARDIDKKFFFKTTAKEMGFTALKTGIATLNCPYTNDYINQNFNLGMLKPIQAKLSLYKTYMKKMIIGEVNGEFVYKNLGITSISPDYESISHMIEVAKNYKMPYNLIDPNDNNSIGLNPFVYDNPLQTSSVITSVLKSMYQETVENVEKAYMESVSNQAIENLCILLKATFPVLHSNDRDYLPSMEDILNILKDFDLAQKMCEKLEEKLDPDEFEKYDKQMAYFKSHFFAGASHRTETEKYVQYVITTLDNLLRYPGVKNILCNRTRNINYDKVLANGELTFLCTQRGDLGATVHKSFGLFFILLMQNSVLRRPGNENTRVPHFLYIDEFPEFLSKAAEPIFTLYRKYKVGTTISTQTLAQLGGVDEKYKQTIISNCINKIVFGNSVIEENEWWSKEFGNVRYWKFGNTYDTSKGEYDPKLSGIGWEWKAKFAPDKVRSLPFKSCLFKWKNNRGVVELCDGKIDFMDAKYKEPKTDKFYDFEKFTSGISDNLDSDVKKGLINRNNHITENNHHSGDVDPIQTDTSDSKFLFDNEDAIIVDFKKNKK